MPTVGKSGPWTCVTMPSVVRKVEQVRLVWEGLVIGTGEQAAPTGILEGERK